MSGASDRTTCARSRGAKRRARRNPRTASRRRPFCPPPPPCPEIPEDPKLLESFWIPLVPSGLAADHYPGLPTSPGCLRHFHCCHQCCWRIHGPGAPWGSYNKYNNSCSTALAADCQKLQRAGFTDAMEVDMAGAGFEVAIVSAPQNPRTPRRRTPTSLPAIYRVACMISSLQDWRHHSWRPRGQKQRVQGV